MAPRGTLIPFLAAVGATWLNSIYVWSYKANSDSVFPTDCRDTYYIVDRSRRYVAIIDSTPAVLLALFRDPCLPHKRSTMYFLLSVDGAVEVLKRMSTGSRVYVDTSIESIGTRPSNVNRRYWKCGHFYVDVRAATFGAEEESTRRRIDVGLCGWFSLPLFSPLYSCTFLLGRRKVQEQRKKSIMYFFSNAETWIFKKLYVYIAFFLFLH